MVVLVTIALVDVCGWIAAWQAPVARRRWGDPPVILERTNPKRAAADPYARKILSIDLPLASSSTNLSR
jgi:hypothetical protein